MSTPSKPWLRAIRLLLYVALCGGGWGPVAAAQPPEGASAGGEVVRIAWIDPLSGPMAPMATSQLRALQFFAKKFSGARNTPGNPAGVVFEVLALDNKLSPAETLAALRQAIDQGVRYVMQGQSSSISAVLLEAVERHNRRYPGREVVFLNHAALDPELTNGKCSHWHFRFDADVSMRMEALALFLKERPEIRRVYLVNQNYAHGLQVVRAAREQLPRKRSDIEVVGDEKHPVAQWRDFTPLMERVRAAGADAIITGNWGSDLALLLGAASQTGFPGAVFAFYASQPGTPEFMGASVAGQVYQVSAQHPNLAGDMPQWQAEYRQRYGEDLQAFVGIHVFRALGEAMAQARSTDPVRVAAALSGLRFQSFNGEVELRAADHQLQQRLYVTRWQPVDLVYRFSVEDTGLTFAPVAEFSAAAVSQPTYCQMSRP